MTTDIKISIIVPVYNVSEYIERCIKSIIAQTYANIECVIVDDCTPDDSITKIQRIINEYKGNIDFKIYHHKQNRGISAARNTGISHATGTYIFFLDSDDYITNNAMVTLKSFINKYGEVDIVQGNYTSIGHGDAYNSINKDFYNKKDGAKSCYLNNIICIFAWNKLIKKEFITNHNLYFKDGIINEDCLWHFYVSQYINSLCYSSSQTYCYLYRDNSITTNKSYNPINLYIIENISSFLLKKKENINIEFNHYVNYYSFGILLLKDIQKSDYIKLRTILNCLRRKTSNLTLKDKIIAFTFYLPFNLSVKYSKCLKQILIINSQIANKFNSVFTSKNNKISTQDE
jgi:glycosyltransferase involved in cell wall biosynthesis